jgi:hypothetical protein
MIGVYGAIGNPSTDADGNIIDQSSGDASGSGGCFLKSLMGK